MIKVTDKYTWFRTEVFREPNGFKVEYEEIDEVPFIHFTFLTKKVTPSLIKMLKILDNEVCDVLYNEGFDKLFSYTQVDNKSVINLAKMLGYKVFKKPADQVILVKSLREEE